MTKAAKALAIHKLWLARGTVQTILTRHVLLGRELLGFLGSSAVLGTRLSIKLVVVHTQHKGIAIGTLARGGLTLASMAVAGIIT